MIDPDDPIRDMYLPVVLTDDDERIVLGGWVFYVRAVHLVRDLYPNSRFWEANLVGALLNKVLDAYLDRQPWKVGIARRGEISTWNDEKVVVVHHETLGAGVSPVARIAALSERVRAGEFLPD